jgi:hypothetical protein
MVIGIELRVAYTELLSLELQYLMGRRAKNGKPGARRQQRRKAVGLSSPTLVKLQPQGRASPQPALNRTGLSLAFRTGTYQRGQYVQALWMGSGSEG